jgi:sugar O-acyltransferase (sialic acid O-acetyltransferase NeuD family)
MAKPLIIVGAGRHGRVVAETAAAAGVPIRGFLDDTKAAGTTVNGVAVLGGLRLLDDRALLAEHVFVVAIGDQQARRRLSLQIAAAGGRLAVLQHPSCVVSPSATIGEGSVLIAGTIVNANTNVGRFCILNTGCALDHDTVLADGVQVGPGARLAGNVTCGEDAFIGTGAICIPRVTIGARAVVGAGAVVIADVPAGVTVVGNPARSADPQAAETRRR